MIELSNSRFLHVPKTGGVWVLNALKAAGLDFQRFVSDDAVQTQHIPREIARQNSADKFTFAFVRHPLGWWKSYWQYKMGVDWHVNTPNHNGIDRQCMSSNFHEFIENVLDKMPGHCGELFDRFVGPPDDPIDFIGKFENLVDDLAYALNIAGEQFRPELLRGTSPANVSDKARFPAEYTPALAKSLEDAESYVLERFGYARNTTAETFPDSFSRH